MPTTKELQDAYATLQALEHAGVDNWEGYGIAMDEIHKRQAKESKLLEILERIEEVLAQGVYEPSERGAGYGFEDTAHATAELIILELL